MMFRDRLTSRRTESAVTASTMGGAPRAKNESKVLCSVVKGKPRPRMVMATTKSSRAKTVTMKSFSMFWMLLMMRWPSFSAVRRSRPRTA